LPLDAPDARIVLAPPPKREGVLKDMWPKQEGKTMDWSLSIRHISIRSRVARAAAGAGVLAAMLVASNAGAVAQSSDPSSQSSDSAARAISLEGAWFVQVTARDCVTGDALGSFNSLVTFARGGTLHESPGTRAFTPGQRSDGHGSWARVRRHTYSQRFVGLILFDTDPNPPISPGILKGWQTIEHTVQLTDADHFTSAGTAEFHDAEGQLYRSGCSTAIGQRLDTI
jgi:hypothetical protein